MDGIIERLRLIAQREDADRVAEAEQVLQPRSITWVVVGDRAEIEDGLRDLNLAELEFFDADGNPAEAPGVRP